MTLSNRPNDAAPGGMRGATRMHDPSEAEHDRMRRRLMNVAFVMMLLATLAQLHWSDPHGCTWLGAVLRELPARRKMELAVYGLLASVVFVQQSRSIIWPLWGVWLYDFITYYHDRPERIRHLYTVTAIMDELRQFPAPWLWTLPALTWEIFRMTRAH